MAGWLFKHPTPAGELHRHDLNISACFFNVSSGLCMKGGKLINMTPVLSAPTVSNCLDFNPLGCEAILAILLSIEFVLHVSPNKLHCKNMTNLDIKSIHQGAFPFPKPCLCFKDSRTLVESII